ncbi:MAG: PEP-CTERM sorting domain-containing protein [Isosphaeraceae bacterium]|nr:PEP-CTERM sorting domain-containing protein [Isosphaeraceae bacterium]
MNRGTQTIFLSVYMLLAAASVSHADQVLFSTSYESPTYSEGPLSGQDGWESSFGIDPMVTSVRSRTGAQGLEVRKTSSLDPFGLTYRTIADATPWSKFSVQHSIYLTGTEGLQGSHLSPLALIGENGFVGQIAIRNGLSADLFTNGVGGSVPIQTGVWIDLRLVLDFQTQTQEGFVNGVSIGSVVFDNPATRLIQVEIFHIIGTDDKPFYLDDLSVTAFVPEPATLGLSALGAMAPLLVRRRNRPDR